MANVLVCGSIFAPRASVSTGGVYAFADVGTEVAAGIPAAVDGRAGADGGGDEADKVVRLFPQMSLDEGGAAGVWR